jgi:hypothetical protein
MPNTYTELLKTTVGTATSSVTLDLAGISGYTDLVVVMSGSKSAASDITLRVGNGSVDTGSNYSRTFLYGDGSSAVSGRQSNQTSISIAYFNTIQSNFILNLNNYSNTTTFKTILSRWNASDVVVGAIACLWRSTAAINIMTLTNVSGNFTVGSTFSVYGIANADQGAAKATGGIITEDSQYWYHTFGASGEFTPKQSLSCDVLAIGGGGAGQGSGYGGGGAGGVIATNSAISLSVTNYSVTVGAGGAKSSGTTLDATSGVNTTFNGATANGGGVGNATGGSGGGGASAFSTAGKAATQTSPSGYTGYGNAGGAGTGATFQGGGGGGSGAAGSTFNGGNGKDTWATWALATSTGVNGFYAGGGAGNKGSSGAAGTAGSGGGGIYPAGNGTANTGSGGCSGEDSGYGGGTSGNGGSGVVIIRYAKV